MISLDKNAELHTKETKNYLFIVFGVYANFVFNYVDSRWLSQMTEFCWNWITIPVGFCGCMSG